jgi:hypothetical protein
MSSFIPHSSQYSLPSILLVAQLLHLIMRLGLRSRVSGPELQADYTLDHKQHQ